MTNSIGTKPNQIPVNGYLGDLAYRDFSSLDLGTAAITGGTIDGTVIGGTTPAAGNFTTGSFTGDVSFGDTPKFYWDASTERLGLGTTSPFGILHLQSTAPTVVITDSDGAGVQASGSISFRDSANAQLTSIGLLSSSNSDLDIFQHQAANIDFWTNSQFAMRIDSSGNVGIGTAAPEAILHVADSSAANDNFTAILSAFRPSLTFQDNSTSTNNDWEIFVDNGAMAFLNGDATTGTKLVNEAMRIDASGLIATSYNETYAAVTSTTNATTVDCEAGNSFSHTLTENTTFTFSNPPVTGTSYAFTLKLVQDAGASGFTVTWPTSVDWPAATAPTLTATASAVDVFVFYTHDAGTTWYGFVAGQGLG